MKCAHAPAPVPHIFPGLTIPTTTSSSMSIKTRIRSFFGVSRQYAVVGASQNPSKFGFKILSWYVSHGLPVVPINPKEKEILGQTVISNVTELLKDCAEKQKTDGHDFSEKDGLSISFLTPPAITTQTLEAISNYAGYILVIKGIWLQPGSYDQKVLDKVEEIGLEGVTIEEDECILVRGEEGMYSANL